MARLARAGGNGGPVWSTPPVATRWTQVAYGDGESDRGRSFSAGNATFDCRGRQLVCMSPPRQIVPGRVYLITRRCTQRQFLLRPDQETNNAFIYCLGYSALRCGVKIVAFIANSNHYHAVVVDVEGRLPELLESFHKLLAKHQNVLRRRSENFWSSSQSSVVELVGAEDVFAKVVYTLTNPVKDHLVERAHHWPGASSLCATMAGKMLSVCRPWRFFCHSGAMPKSVEISFVRAPGFEQHTDAEYARILSDAIGGVESDAAAERLRTGRRVLGRRTILTQSPFDKPSSREPRRQLDPRVAALEKGPGIEALARRKAFLDEYARARARWVMGEDVEFPVGTWWLRRHCRGVICASLPLA